MLLTGWAIGWMLAAFPEDSPPFGEPITWAGTSRESGRGPLVTLAVMPTVMSRPWRGSTSRITSVGGGDHVRSRASARRDRSVSVS